MYVIQSISPLKEEVILENGAGGYLCLKVPLPGMGRDVNGDRETFKREYFSKFKGSYKVTAVTRPQLQLVPMQYPIHLL